MAGTAAFMLPPLPFGVDFPNLSPLLKGVLTAHLLAGAGVSGYVAGYRLKMGLIVLPLAFLILTSLTCWWITSR